MLVGGYIARLLFPVVETKQVVRTLIEQAPPTVVERVVYDTLRTTRWRTKIVYKTIRPHEIIEIPAFEVDTLNWAVVSAQIKGKDLTVDVYHLPTSKLEVTKFEVVNDWQLRLNQYRSRNPVVIMEERNLFDIKPQGLLGWNSMSGPFLALRQRFVWLNVDWRAEEEGLSVEGWVRVF